MLHLYPIVAVLAFCRIASTPIEPAAVIVTHIGMGFGAATAVASVSLIVETADGFPRIPETARGMQSLAAMWQWDCRNPSRTLMVVMRRTVPLAPPGIAPRRAGLFGATVTPNILLPYSTSPRKIGESLYCSSRESVFPSLQKTAYNGISQAAYPQSTVF